MKGKNQNIKNYITKFLREFNFVDWRLIFCVLRELNFAIEKSVFFSGN